MVTVCPRRLRPELQAAADYWLAYRDLPGSPWPGSIWDYPALASDVWRILSAESEVVIMLRTEREREKREAAARLRGGAHGGR